MNNSYRPSSGQPEEPAPLSDHCIVPNDPHGRHVEIPDHMRWALYNEGPLFNGEMPHILQ